MTKSHAHCILLPLLFLSQLVHYSAEESQPHQICSHFLCGGLGNISFPFFRIGHPRCGAIAMNCSDEPKAQFYEKGKWYHVKYINTLSMRVEIHDTIVENHLASNRCDLLETFTEQAYLESFTEKKFPFVSFKIKETRPFFKCSNQFDGYSCKDDDLKFFHKFDKYGCTDYGFYFENQEKVLPSLPKNLSRCCSVVFLTFPREYEDKSGGLKYNALWRGATFIIDWELIPACVNCFANGGECLSTPNKGFKCGNKGAHNGKMFAIGGGGIRLKARIGIGLSILAVAIVAVVLLLKYVIKWKPPSWKKKTLTTMNFEACLKDCASLAPKRYNFKEIKIMTKSFKNKLGHGGYGSVFKGVLNNGKLVAVKVLSKNKGNGEEFINEVASISRTSHVNIVSLLGYCFDGSKRALVYDFMPNGSLEKYIYDKDSSEKSNNLEWATIYQIAVGIARGLEYLHRGCNTRILHFDIKPHNILLDQDFCPKISDFGLAKLCPRKESIISMLGARGTAGYIAPEVYCRNFGGISHKSDVYSYGMMILEMVGGRKNIALAVEHTSEIYFPHWIHKRIELNEGLGLHGVVTEVEVEITRKMILVGLWCIQTNPLDRPAMSRVLEMFEGSLGVLEIPPKPYLSSPGSTEGG